MNTIFLLSLFQSANLIDNLSLFRILLFNVSKEEWLNLKKKKIKISEKYILEKIQERINAKNSGNYDLADKIRNELLNEGILIEDRTEKTIWKFK